MHPLFEEFFSLLRFSLGITPKGVSRVLAPEEWRWLHEQAKRQCLLGVLYKGIEKLPADHRPPRDLLLRWSLEANQIAAMNTRMNETAAKLTKMFADRGARTVILKGQANALFYPDPLSRQAGDIDIWVEGGLNYVLELLNEAKLMENASICEHHVHLDAKLFDGITVEVHFIPTINRSPITNGRMQKFLTQEIKKTDNILFTKNNFFMPPITYALVMQLSHLLRHFYNEGIGLRQLVDYNLLLKKSTEIDRNHVQKILKKTGLHNIAGAVMWIMKEFFGTSSKLLLCPPDEYRGLRLMATVLNGGNFGKYSEEYSRKKNSSWKQIWIINRSRALKRLDFDFSESIWDEINYIITFLKQIPIRIKEGKISLRK